MRVAVIELIPYFRAPAVPEEEDRQKPRTFGYFVSIQTRYG
jgi:hypothetical protein